MGKIMTNIYGKSKFDVKKALKPLTDNEDVISHHSNYGAVGIYFVLNFWPYQCVIVSGSTPRCVRIQLSPVTRHPAFAGMDLSPLKYSSSLLPEFPEVLLPFYTTTTMATQT